MTPKLNKVSYLLFAIIALILGSVFQFYNLKIPDFWVEGLLVAGFIAVFVFLKGNQRLKSVYFILGFIILFLLGNRNAYFSEDIIAENYFTNITTSEQPVYTIEITDHPIEKPKSYGLEAEVIQVNQKASIGSVQLYFEKTAEAKNLKPGDIIQTSCQFNRIRANTNPHSFDYASFSRVKGRYHQAYIPVDNWGSVSSGQPSFFTFTTSIRAHFDDVLERSNIPKSELGVIKALVLGDKVNLENRTQENYAAAGAMHILAVSGLHVGIVLLILSVLFKPIKRVKRGKLYFSIIIILCIWTYAFITGASSSVLRAAFMFSLISIGINLQRDQSTIQAVMVSAFFLILVNPFIIFDVGFQLSYAAVLGIIFLQPKIASYLLIKNKFLNYFWQIMAVSIAAQIATAPFSLYYFHQFPTYFLLTNLVVIPAAFLILFLGILFLSLSWVPILGDGLIYTLQYATYILNGFVSGIAHLPGAVLSGYYLLKTELVILYGIIVFTTLFWVYRIKRSLMLTSTLIVGFIIISTIHEFGISHKSEVVFFDLNKGSGISIREGNRHIFIHQNIAETDFQYNVSPYWLHELNNNEPQDIINLENVNRINFRDEKIKIFTGDEDQIHSDILYFSEDVFLNNEIQNEIKKESPTIILGGDCSIKFYWFLEKSFESVHFLKNQGAFILNTTPSRPS